MVSLAPVSESKRAFAARVGYSQPYISKLAKEGRLVLEGSGPTSRVIIAESLKLMEQTGGSRPDVAARFAQERSNRAKTQAGEYAAKQIDSGAIVQAAGAPDSGIDKIGSNYQAARAVKEKYAALTAKASYETMIGNLIPREDVDAAMRFVGAAVRSAMDVFPDQQAPVLCAIADIHEVRATLADACRNVLIDVGQAIDRQKKTLIKEG